MKKIALLLVAVVLLIAPLYGAEETKPNFSGKWVLDTSKSDFGPLPAPDGQTYEMDHQDPKLKVTITTKTAQGERTVERNYTTDGKENSNKAGNNEIKSKTRWNEKKLAMEAVVEPAGVEIKEMWELSEEGKKLTISRDLKSPQGEASVKLIFDKK